MTLSIGITLGDVTGIGPEVTRKALGQATSEFPDASFVVLGDRAWLQRGDLHAPSPFRPWEPMNPRPGIAVFDPRAMPLPIDLAPGSPRAARAALDWLREGARRCLEGALAALVTAPVCKESIIAGGETIHWANGVPVGPGQYRPHHHDAPGNR